MLVALKRFICLFLLVSFFRNVFPAQQPPKVLKRDLLLHEVIKKKFDDPSERMKIVLYLLGQNPLRVTFKDQYGRTPLHLASYLGLTDIVQELLKFNAEMIAFDLEDQGANTPLHLAVQKNQVNVVKILINEWDQKKYRGALGEAVGGLLGKRVERYLGEKKHIVEIKNKYGLTPFHLAAYLGNMNILEKLLNSKASPKNYDFIIDSDKRNLTPLHYAAQYGHKNMFKKLYSVGADEKFFKEIALHAAAFGGDLDLVKMVIEDKVDINAIDENGRTAMHFSSALGHEDVVTYFVKRDRSLLYSKDRNGQTPLHLAALAGQKKIVPYLIKKKADVTERDRAGKTALQLSVAAGKHEIAIFLLNFENDVNAALRDVAQVGNKDIVAFLLGKGAKIDEVDEDGNNALHVAAQAGQVKMVEFLLNRDEGMKNVGNDEEKTPLHLAAQEGHTNVVEFLIKRKSRKYQEDVNGNTPLYLAAVRGHSAVVRKLFNVRRDKKIAKKAIIQGGHLNVVNVFVEKHADPNFLFRAAVRGGFFDVVKFLYAQQADINEPGKQKKTPLHIAAEEGYLDIVNFLLKKKEIILDARDSSGQTALHLAAKKQRSRDLVKNERRSYRNYFWVVVNLVQKGLKLDVIDNERKTPLHIAAEYNNDDIVDYFLMDPSLFEKGMGLMFTHLKKVHDRFRLGTIFRWRKGIAGFFLGRDEITKSAIELADYNAQIITALAQRSAFRMKHRAKIIADVDAKDENGNTALHLAAQVGASDSLKKLLEKKAYVNATNEQKNTPLHLAAQRKRGAGDIEQLLVGGAHSEAKNDDDNTPLHVALLAEKLKSIKKLLEQGADVYAFDHQGNTSLHLAAKNTKFLKVLPDLLKKATLGTAVKNKDGDTPLHIAAKHGHSEVIKALIQHEKEYNQSTWFEDTNIKEDENEKGETPLIVAAKNGQKGAVELLIDEESNINAIDDDGKTALHVTAEKGFDSIYDFLVVNKADTTLIDEGGFTALQRLKEAQKITPEEITELQTLKDVLQHLKQKLIQLIQALQELVAES